MALHAELRVDLVALKPALLDEAVGVLARGMRDNPIHVAAFGPDPERRVRILFRMFGDLFRVLDGYEAVCATRAGAIVGVAGRAESGACTPTALQKLRLAPALLSLGLGTAVRSSRWMSAWSKRDPRTPHSHFGPFAVDSHLQGQGIGSVMLADYCAHVDEGGGPAYLETDKAENVRLYQRHGFELVDEADVLGMPNWFMSRPPAGRRLSAIG
jgi:GNAT superfamily N-acetyltransferase